MKLLLPFRHTGVALAIGLFCAGPLNADNSAKTDWTKTYSVSDRGGYVVGNPAAPTKLVEYASYTCGHCANFEVNEAPKVKSNEVAFGGVSFELRNYIRDGADLTVALLARCGGKESFFADHKYWMETQAQWIVGTSRITTATNANLDNRNVSGFLLGVYTDMRLAPYAAKRGLTNEKARACLSDVNMRNAIMTMSNEAIQELKLPGTPSFLINGVAVPAHDYATLKPFLMKK
ncbi:MAG: thioredoxin domain-containing protein [Sphingorhabdus sp.]